MQPRKTNNSNQATRTQGNRAKANKNRAKQTTETKQSKQKASKTTNRNEGANVAVVKSSPTVSGGSSQFEHADSQQYGNNAQKLTAKRIHTTETKLLSSVVRDAQITNSRFLLFAYLIERSQISVRILSVVPISALFPLSRVSLDGLDFFQDWSF
jgi:hypothetical protein